MDITKITRAKAMKLLRGATDYHKDVEPLFAHKNYHVRQTAMKAAIGLGLDVKSFDIYDTARRCYPNDVSKIETVLKNLHTIRSFV